MCDPNKSMYALGHQRQTNTLMVCGCSERWNELTRFRAQVKREFRFNWIHKYRLAIDMGLRISTPHRGSSQTRNVFDVIDSIYSTNTPSRTNAVRECLIAWMKINHYDPKERSLNDPQRYKQTQILKFTYSSYMLLGCCCAQLTSSSHLFVSQQQPTTTWDETGSLDMWKSENLPPHLLSQQCSIN